ncbi:uncharacterized protein [Apostichopus japonicus]|uniref:uncharacterized protein isoform X2 n=1 Tax=Stichopus japonicus TaxID=307972 RepID=UPI003AB136CA
MVEARVHAKKAGHFNSDFCKKNFCKNRRQKKARAFGETSLASSSIFDIFGRKVLNQVERMSTTTILLVIFLTQSGLVQGKLKVTLRNRFAFNAGRTGAYFTCHISETDKTGLTVTSRRVVYTSENPPANDPSNVSDGVYKIDLNSYSSVGAFACDISRTGRELTSIQTILLKSGAYLLPDDRLLTRTVNAGDEAIVLRMDEVFIFHDFVFWRKDGGSFFNSGSLTLNVPQSGGIISLSDAGIYDCFYNNLRSFDVQGLQRIIVRACPADHWGPPDCIGICDNCYNGGVCDDTTGECICPVGFNGSNCLSACDPLGRFGYNCEFPCAEGQEVDSACRDYMFCLPDPFGCRCASGFKGLDCRTSCPRRKFGANCLQTCHCNSGGCNRMTGECYNNDICQPGYSGTNCQIPRQCKQGYYGSQCLSKCHCRNGASCNRNTGRCFNDRCAQGFNLRDPNVNCQECATGFYGINCEQECHCNGACHNVNGTCDGECKTPWVNWSPRCQTGIADIQVSKVNPGATAEIKCTVESPDDLATVTVRLSVTGANRSASFVGNRIELSSQSIVQLYKVSSVTSEDVFSCYLAYRDNTLVNDGRHYRRKEADLYVLPLIASSPYFISASNTTITISWTAWNDSSDIGDPPVIGYVPYHRTNEEEDWISSGSVQAKGMPTLSFTFSNLQPDTLYQFCVAAVREGPFGEGPKSPFESARTYCPKTQPLDVQARLTDTGSTTVLISWKVPDEIPSSCKASLIGFLIYVSDFETKEILDIVAVMDPNVEVYTYETPGKNIYNFQVKLVTDAGYGPLSELTEYARISLSGHSYNIVIVVLIVIITLTLLIALPVVLLVYRRHSSRAHTQQIEDTNGTEDRDEVHAEPNIPDEAQYLPLKGVTEDSLQI